MLALVSALVTFDAWPTRDGGASANDVPVQQAPKARVVRAVRHTAAARSRSRRAAARHASGSLARARRVSGAHGGTGPGNPPSDGGSPDVPSAPPPVVPLTPPGEDPTPGRPVAKRDHHPSTPSPVHEIACGATSALTGVGGGAGGAFGAACKSVPTGDPSSDGSSPIAIVPALKLGGG